MAIKRVFVEKKPGCDVESVGLCKDLKENLGISALEGVRILCRYDVEDIKDDVFEKAVTTIFSEPPVDNVYLESITLAEDEKAFGMEYLPGQYDQRADSAMQCIQILSGDDAATVGSAKIYVLKGKLTDADVDKIKKYCINPVDKDYVK